MGIGCFILCLYAANQLLWHQGSRPDESLDMDLALPLFQPQPTPEPQQIKTQSMGGLLPGRLAGVADLLPVPRFAPSSLLPGWFSPRGLVIKRSHTKVLSY